MLRPFCVTVREGTTGGERPPPRSQPDQHDLASCEFAPGGGRQARADPARIEALTLSSSSRNPNDLRDTTTWSAVRALPAKLR